MEQRQEIVATFIFYKFDSLDQGKPMEWVYTLLPEAKVRMKESGETAKLMV
jgi:hypothetical protein